MLQAARPLALEAKFACSGSTADMGSTRSGEIGRGWKKELPVVLMQLASGSLGLPEAHGTGRDHRWINASRSAALSTTAAGIDQHHRLPSPVDQALSRVPQARGRLGEGTPAPTRSSRRELVLIRQGEDEGAVGLGIDQPAGELHQASEQGQGTPSSLRSDQQNQKTMRVLAGSGTCRLQPPHLVEARQLGAGQELRDQQPGVVDAVGVVLGLGRDQSARGPAGARARRGSDRAHPRCRHHSRRQSHHPLPRPRTHAKERQTSHRRAAG